MPDPKKRRQKRLHKKKHVTRGFTLIELLVVIGIISLLAVMIVLAINPGEIQKKSRDAKRLSDIATMRKAIDFTITDGGGPPQGSSAVHFTADSSGTKTTSTANNYIGLNVVKYLSILPDDPEHISGNSTLVTLSDGITKITRDNMRYFFASDGNFYEINAYLESSDNNETALNDGGDSALRYEMGTQAGLNLIVGP